MYKMAGLGCSGRLGSRLTSSIFGADFISLVTVPSGKIREAPAAAKHKALKNGQEIAAGKVPMKGASKLPVRVAMAKVGSTRC
mmetsp:Transcript_53125/g.65119  ORF Transcript_53125/g.65119 Transcript_53125/m.65119 type:complete len:83 (+) Transcript_53125:117-365(+)